MPQAKKTGNVILWQANTGGKKYYCEKCDKSFRSDDDLILHEAEHVTCNRDGCEFTAHPKIIAKHKKMQHDSGLYKRIGKLYTQEEITQWIEERKRRYPTKKVIEEKKAMEDEKQKRGEKLKDDDSRFNKSFQKKNVKIKGQRKTKFKSRAEKINEMKKKRKQERNRNITVQYAIEEEKLALRGRVPPFSGIGSLIESNDSDKAEVKEKDPLETISDEDEYECFYQGSTATPLLSNSLGLLASAYDSDEEEIQPYAADQVNGEQISDKDGGPPDEVKTISVKSEPSEESVPEVVLTRKQKCKKNSFKKKRKEKKPFQNHQNGFESRKLTLLEKLLKREIRHERNIILQCVNYVVRNNFFKEN